MMSFLAMLKLVPRWMWLGLAVLAVMDDLTRWQDKVNIDAATVNDQ